MLEPQPRESPSTNADTEGNASSGSRGRVLLAEDDDMLAAFLERTLQAEGYAVRCVQDGPAVLAELDPAPDLLLLDLNLPKLDGLSVLRELRPRFPRLPILVLTARSRADGLLPALDIGADDCVTKPFSYVELLARIRALLRRTQPAVVVVRRFADLELCPDRRSVLRGGRRIQLTQREFALLEFLLRTPTVAVPRAVLLKEVWGDATEPTTNVVDVYMKYLRDKIDGPAMPKLIHTVRGVGYAIDSM